MANSNRKLVDSEEKVFNRLLEIGYPKKSIILEGPLNSYQFVDFIINDIDTGLPIMILEVKSFDKEKNYISTKQSAFNTLKRYYKINASPVKAVAAILDREKNTLRFIDFTEAIKDDNINCAVENYALPPYEILTIGAQQKAISKQEQKQQRKLDTLKLICWRIIPSFSLIFILLDAFGIYTFSTLRLITIGVCFAAILIPCFKEIKIGEISLKSIIEKQKEETK